ncbi:hypothetical protein [Crocosphaera sp. XPORK-15E]|uniref:hypothetical protein n=1 Tax=Crocosphaera sp. XPORK-15E TaxID=3110247 RepID=UPI002B20FFE2|nr:hypothetical protein [Crocosphaera sp. XPORK-15E]MEA5535228.1 hypothetical protein [Crocosphaera sp. XPORK-15E]
MKTYIFALIISLFSMIPWLDIQATEVNLDNRDSLLQQLKNAVYSLPDGQKIALLDGRSQYHNLSFILQEKVAIGDINGDAIQDAIVVLTSFQQGIQVGNYLAVFIANQEKQFNNLDTLKLQDNITLEMINIEAQQLTINFLAYSPRDLVCCPSQKKQLKYDFDPISKTLIPLSMETRNKPQDSLRINRRSREIEENNELQIKF